MCAFASVTALAASISVSTIPSGKPPTATPAIVFEDPFNVSAIVLF